MVINEQESKADFDRLLRARQDQLQNHITEQQSFIGLPRSLSEEPGRSNGKKNKSPRKA